MTAPAETVTHLRKHSTINSRKLKSRQDGHEIGTMRSDLSPSTHLEHSSTNFLGHLVLEWDRMECASVVPKVLAFQDTGKSVLAGIEPSEISRSEDVRFTRGACQLARVRLESMPSLPLFSGSTEALPAIRDRKVQMWGVISANYGRRFDQLLFLSKRLFSMHGHAAYPLRIIYGHEP